MKILGIDTSSKRCTVCILEDTNVILELHSDDEKTHSQTLMPLIDKLFKNTNLCLKDINLLACCIGPGSFTGVRIGIATSKAFTDVYHFPTVGVSSLEGLAYNIDEINSHIICPIIDAKNNNVYYGIFNENYNKLEDFSSCSIEELINKINSYNSKVIFVGDGVLSYKETLETKLNVPAIFAEGETNFASSISIAKFAYNTYTSGNFRASLSPMYLRKSQAERSLEERRI